MDYVEPIGYLASALVFLTFAMKTIIPLRILAIASNMAFLSYGYFGGMEPIFLLHAALLPLNSWRLFQTWQLLAAIRGAATTDLNFDWLLPYMTKCEFKAGEPLFRKGDPANKMFTIVEGTARHVELGIDLVPGSLVGEIGIFSPHKTRTGTIVAQTDLKAMAIAEFRVRELYHDNREAGFYLISLITKRLVANMEALEAKVSERSASAAKPQTLGEAIKPVPSALRL
ncbi:CRP-like cAMP-binding protein [Rhodoligotrophos appendicifer]|uniref:Crp/Fnr family transcriptional regulator n=1 Tax=Rhodoligotrophos appendicifer TaxID=987056 RepID=UPI001184C2F4|nr:cyclic nucleotide-binding domain-containing protein [Rhodoligotrophos appendicifer]